ncbi:MAG TPA: hypothetical protein VD927_06295 [Chryseosolibacter sp.]|nr:hypothetical protein [Chryseosolibacter sp.]
MSEETKELTTSEKEEVRPEKALAKKETIVAFKPEFKDALIAYLESRPEFKEVATLVADLKQAKPFEITING